MADNDDKGRPPDDAGPRGQSVFGAIKDYAVRLKAKTATQTPARPMRVLVVDDEEPVRKFVDRVLQKAGYETSVASDGPDALEIAQKVRPLDILVTDLMMPLMAGDELARRLRQSEPALKVLYLTAYSDRLFKERSTLWQDEAFLEKPCSVKGLVEAVSLLRSGRIDTPEK